MRRQVGDDTVARPEVPFQQLHGQRVLDVLLDGPLKRAIQDRLLDPLATKLLLGEFKPGDRIKVVARDGELEFAKK